jgi:hypothetical protein
MLLDRESALAMSVATPGREPIGLRMRKRRPGPEADLVDAFLSTFDLAARSDERVTIFREPEIESGAPDLVVVFWKPSVAAQWPHARAHLGSAALRLAHLIAGTGPVTDSQLESLFYARTATLLDRLGAAKVIERHRGRWRLRPTSEVFAVRQIVTFEAKVGDWRGAIRQAAANTWFASRSYALFPAVVRSSYATELARSAGVGIWAGGRRVLGASRRTQPASYASWLFNEWSWRASAPEPE